MLNWKRINNHTGAVWAAKPLARVDLLIMQTGVDEFEVLLLRLGSGSPMDQQFGKNLKEAKQLAETMYADYLIAQEVHSTLFK